MQLALALLSAYLLGSLPTAYIAGRILRGIDVRQYGSGNVGGSNAGVLLGKGALVGVGLVDLGKGALSVVVVRWLGMDLDAQALAGLGVVAGHNWSLYLRFTGGRGGGSALGALLGMGLLELVGVAAGLALLGLLLRRTPLGMGVAAAVLPLASLALGQPPAVILFCTGLLALLAAKRLMANGEAFTPGLSRRQVLLNRLLYDRDIRDREQWVYRAPSPDDPQG